MSAKSSMAVWCENHAVGDDSLVEFHFNLWRFAEDAKGIRRKRNARDDLLEVGVMLDDPAKIKCINIFFPFLVERNDISDCGPRFAKDKIANGIFNEQLDITSKSGDKCVALSKGDEPFCDVHQFTMNEGVIDAGEIQIQDNVGGGCIVCITPAALKSLKGYRTDGARGYFRLRVKLQSGSSNPYVNTIEPADKGWNSSIDHIEYVDFRLNEARTLPVKVSEAMKIASAGLAKVKVVAFLTAVPMISAIASSHEAWRKSRLLEYDVWKNYVEGGVPDGMVVYHWKAEVVEKQYVEDFSAFVKLHTRKTGGKILTTYVMVAFVFGVIGNLTASWIEPPISAGATSIAAVFSGAETLEPPKDIETSSDVQTSVETREANE